MTDKTFNEVNRLFEQFSLPVVFALTATGIVGITSPASANQCKQGFVWREASPTDLVCVEPAQRDQAVYDNAAAASRIAPCRPGFVLRGATRGDRVCVTPAARDEASREKDLNRARSTFLLCARVSEDPSRCPNPAPCKQGFVHRQATSNDFICASPQARVRVQQENVNGSQNKGTNTCIDGYVWRGAFSGDSVCVKPEVRAQVERDNANASSRVASNISPPPSSPTTPSSPTISVAVEQAQFVVSGPGFRPNVKGYMRIVYPDFSSKVFEDTPDGSGKLNFKMDVSSLCIPGANLTLSFTFNQPDASGRDKFTNTVSKSCPS